MTGVVHAHAESDSVKTSRAIAIAYDNSGSMISDDGGPSDKWCKAKYSLEVLAAMLDKADSLSVFTMDSPGCKLSFSGSESADQRAAKVHDADLGYSTMTNTYTTQEAYESLLASSADERYLVITTDGAFNSEGSAEESLAAVQRVVDDCASQGITVIYLAIGSDAALIQGNEAAGVYVKTASTDNILTAMTEVANQVFGRASLPASAYAADAGSITLDVPMSNLIVFAQGQDVSVGALKNDDGSFSSEAALVQHSDDPGASNTGPFLVDDSLQGVVAVFDDDVHEGTYDLEVAGYETLDVYYKPYVDVAVKLTSEDGMSYELKSGESNDVPAGTYEAAYSFKNPFTGEELTSDLLYPAEFSLRVFDGETTRDIAEGEPVELAYGEATLFASALVPGGVHATQQYDAVHITPPLGSLTVDASGVVSSSSVDDLASAGGKITVSKQNGEAFTPEEWEATSLSVADEAGLTWDVTKTEEIGVFEAHPAYDESGKQATSDRLFGSIAMAPASVPTTFDARVDVEANPYAGRATASFQYAPNITDTLVRWWWLIALLLLLLWFIIMEIRKPRLPKLAPGIELDGDFQRFAYNRKISHRVMPPWAPEKTTFTTQRIVGFAPDAFELYERYQLQQVGVQAIRGKGRRKSFRIDDDTLAAMRAHEEGGGTFPKPEYTCLVANRFSRGSSFRFTGWVISRSGKKREEEYVIRFS